MLHVLFDQIDTSLGTRPLMWRSGSETNQLYTVKRVRLFYPYLVTSCSCIPFVRVTHKVQREHAYNLNLSVVVKLPSFVKLVCPFRKSKVCCFFASAPGEFLVGCMVVVEMTGNVAKYIGLLKSSVNKKGPQ